MPTPSPQKFFPPQMVYVNPPHLSPGHRSWCIILHFHGNRSQKSCKHIRFCHWSELNNWLISFIFPQESRDTCFHLRGVLAESAWFPSLSSLYSCLRLMGLNLSSTQSETKMVTRDVNSHGWSSCNECVYNSITTEAVGGRAGNTEVFKQKNRFLRFF